MKPEKQRIALAEWCGWKRHVETYKDGTVACENWVSPNGVGLPPPDYLNDLNAMHSVLVDKVCGNAELERRFLKELKAIHDRIADSEDITPICEWDMVLVASECDWLAEALLHAIGKWEDDK